MRREPSIVAGASEVDITPRDSQFLYGYPHVERYSTGVHDRLKSSALYLSDGEVQLLFISNDIIYAGRETVARVRSRIRRQSGVPDEAVMVTATHTHSGPITVDLAASREDPVVPRVDPAYLELLEDGMVRAAVEAVDSARGAAVGFTVADGTGIGTNRRDPSGPADLEVPVMAVRDVESDRPLACMIVCCMHPTVLHEDSMLISGDFPGEARMRLKADMLGGDVPVVYHTGPSGNQSPRHVVSANTFHEAERLGGILAESVMREAASISYRSDAKLGLQRRLVTLPRRSLPVLREARDRLAMVRDRYQLLLSEGASRQACRTAECDVFGAEETVALARAAAEGNLQPYYESCLPAEIQIFRVGDCTYVGWPGELFIEYDLAVKAKFPGVYPISMANGELQGYIVTEEAVREGGYEASNALFGPDAGAVLVEETCSALACMR